MFRTLAVLCSLWLITGAVDLQNVVDSCCPKEARDCCTDSVKFLKPLHCFNDSSAMETASDCIQTKLFGERSKLFANIEDTECCAVFASDDNDPEGNCSSVCVASMQTPSLRSKEKLSKIKKCQFRNPLNKCFRSCQRWLRARTSPAPFPIASHCEISDMMLAGKMYIGEEVRRPL